MKKSILILSLILSSLSYGDILEDFDSLGGNDVLLDKAQAINPEIKVKIVQNRIVKRKNRHEFYSSLGAVLGGDSYVNSSLLALNHQYHINPHWSLGLNYTYYTNDLSNEAKNLIKDRQSRNVEIPDLDWPEQSYSLVGNWYPVYGKFNFLDRAIIHFDSYLSLGIGQVELRRGETPLYSAGIGMSLWLSQYLTSRIEFKYQTYEAEFYTGKEQIHGTAASLSMGYLL